MLIRLGRALRRNRLTAWDYLRRAAGHDVREAAVSGDERRASLLGCPEDILIGVTTQANIPHVEGLMS
jgi:hypothetical protein